MRLSIILLLIAVNCMWGSESYSQKTKLTLDFQNTKVSSVLDKIEDESEFFFLYSNKLVDVNRKVNISVNKKKIGHILNELFANTDVTYMVMNRQIVLSKKDYLAKTLDKLQQQIEVTGTVTDAQTGEPLPGVNIVVQGTTQGATTDMDGEYSIEAPGDATLVFSFVGYQEKTLSVDGREEINVSLRQAVTELEEVVAIGYGTREVQDLTGAISSIKESEITKSTNVSMSPQLKMQGEMAGVFVSNTGSDPTARPEVRIRGISTLGYNDPLYVIDGVPVTEGGAASESSRAQDLRGPINIFSMINPEDIESISVLKDASATAIYGVRASNGVILINTKRGEKGKMKVNASASYGVQNLNHRYDVTNVEEYVMLSKEAWNNNTAYTRDKFYPLFDENSPEYLGNSEQYTKDWLDAGIQRNAPIYDYDISVSGGNQTSNYSLGANYAYHEDVVFKSNVERYNLYINSDHQLTDWLKVGETLRLALNQTDRNGGGGLGKAFVPPWQPLYDSDGRNGYALPGREIGGTFYTHGYGNGTVDNDFAIAEYNVNKRNLLRTLGSVYAELSPFKGFRIKGTYRFDYYTNQQEVYKGMDRGYFESQRGQPYEDEGNTYRRRFSENINLVGEFLIGYKRSFGNHNFDAILNAMNEKVKWNNAQYGIRQNSKIPNWEQRRIRDIGQSDDRMVYYERNPSGLMGYMGRLSYNFNQKYYLDATVRRDGSSNFAPGYKWGTFPSFALAWRISDEPFMSGVNWLHDLKLRAGWGQTGNQETRAYAWLSSVNQKLITAFGDNPRYAPGDGNLYTGARLMDFPIKDLTWETVTTKNIGFDSRLFGGKINFTAEYYYRFTDGILQEIDIPLVVGAINDPEVNLAEVENSGFEFSGGYRESFGELGVNASFNFTTVKNEVVKLYENRPYGGNQSRIKVGYPINYLYGYKTDGIFQSEGEVDEWLDNYDDPGNTAQKSPGDVKYVDLYGAPGEDAPEEVYKSSSPDGKINFYDQTYLGKTNPGYYYGITLGTDYKGFDLYLKFRGSGDVQKVYRMGKQSIDGGEGNYLKAYLDRWTPENPSTSIPRALYDDPVGNNRFADRFVEDAGFFRFQNFQLGYTFKDELLNRLGLTNLRIYLSGGNLFVLTPYPGLDPENITTPTTYTLGVNLNF